MGAIAAGAWEQETFAEARAEYLLWHQALTVLADSIADSLLSHVAQRPAAPQTPWIEGTCTDNPKAGKLLVTPQVIAAIHEARRRGRRRAV